MKEIRSILLIISGSVAAYKSLELIRQFSAKGVKIHAILTKGGREFITPLAVSSLSGTKTYTDLFSLTDEVEMGHIELSRMADAVLVAPASAHLLAQMAQGLCDDLASTALLATNKPVFVAPAMNHKMWEHPATQRNIAQLQQDGITLIAPEMGEMACKEYGMGRLAALETIVDAVLNHKASTVIEAFPLQKTPAPGGAPLLKGKHAIITSGATYEPIDPVRFLGNHSSGKQGHALACALAELGANVTLIAGNCTANAPNHPNITMVPAKTAQAMHDAAVQALPADIFIGAAAVADWQAEHTAPQKIKKEDGAETLTLTFTKTVDVLANIATHKHRPELVIGFAAESENLAHYASEKLRKKSLNWVIANNIQNGVFGADENEVLLLKTGEPARNIPKQSKHAIAQKIAQEIAAYFSSTGAQEAEIRIEELKK